MFESNFKNYQKRFQHNNKAFTLIEILLVVTLIIALSGIATGFYSRFINQNAASDTQNQLINQLRKAQHYSMVGKTDGTNNVWGVRFTTSPRRLTLFLQGGTIEEHFSVNDNINIVFDPASPSEITFAHLTGVPSSTPSITVSNTSSNTYRSIAVNSQGLVEHVAPILPVAPTVTTQAATNVTTSDATLNGLANPNGYDTSGYFRYSSTDPGSCNDTFGTKVPFLGGNPLGSGSTNASFLENISGLFPSTPYYFCAIAENAGGKSYGGILTFSTGGPPTVNTLAVNTKTSTTATLEGNANPNGFATTGWFRYDTTNPGTCNDTFGTKVPSLGQELGSGNSVVPLTENITSLLPNTTYYYCAIAASSGGTSFGTTMNFLTDPPPVIQFIGQTSNGGSNPSSGTFDLSTISWSPGDVAVFWWYAHLSTKLITPPATITQKQNASSNTACGGDCGRLFIGYRRLQTGDPSSYTWNSTGGTGGSGGTTTIWGTSVFRNVNATGDPFEAQSGAPAAFANILNPDPPAVTTLTANSMVIPIYGKRDDYTTITPPSGYTNAGSNSSTSGADASAAAAYFLKPTSGSEDPGAWALTGGAAATSDGYLWTGVLKP